MSERQGSITAEQLLADVERGILIDDIDSFMPPSLFGPATPMELATAPTRRKSLEMRTRRTRTLVIPVRRIGPTQTSARASE
jgi:hypothetical protein